MGFDTDMRKVQERLKKWVESNTISIEAFAAIEGMINYYGGERERLFDSLQNDLKRDRDGQGNWDSQCDKALSMLDSANSSIGNKLSGGFAALGMSDFYEGEKANWQQCKNSKICAVAEAIYTCSRANADIFNKFEQDLKKSREEGKVVEELSRSAYGTMTDAAKEGAAQVMAMVVAAPVTKVPFVGKVLAPVIRKLVLSMTTNAAVLKDLARKKAIARKLLVENRDLHNKAKQEIGTEAIDVWVGRARNLIDSWKTTRGDYNAEDWGQFARPCKEIMEVKAVQATEKAKSLKETMMPLYEESINKAFISLFSDPESLERLNTAYIEQVMKMMDDLAKEDAVFATLMSNSANQLANREMRAIMEEVMKAVQELKQALRDSYDIMKG